MMFINTMIAKVINSDVISLRLIFFLLFSISPPTIFCSTK